MDSNFIVPENFDEILEEYTKQGFRVIALAHRCVEFRSINKLQKVQREELEKELTFLGAFMFSSMPSFLPHISTLL